MDHLVLSDTRATINLIVQLFTVKLKQKVESVLTEKYGFGLKDKRLIDKYPRAFERDPRRFCRIGLKTLVDIISSDFTLYVSSKDPCTILSLLTFLISLHAGELQTVSNGRILLWSQKS